MTIFTAAKGETITLDDLPYDRAVRGDLAVVVWKDQFFVARFDYTQNGVNWAIWQEYGFNTEFLALSDCEGIIRCGDGTFVRSSSCVSLPSVKPKLAAEYKELIGYDPFEDDPAISVAEVAQILKEYKEELNG